MAVLGKPVSAAHVAREVGLPRAGLVRRDPLAGDARLAAAGLEAGFPGLVFFADRDEVTTRVFDGGARDPAQDATLFHALDRRLEIVDAVAASRVKQPVRTAGGARGEIALLDQHGLDAAQGEIAQHAGPRRPAAENDDAGCEIRHLGRAARGRSAGPFPARLRHYFFLLLLRRVPPAAAGSFSTQFRVRLTAFFQPASP